MSKLIKKIISTTLAFAMVLTTCAITPKREVKAVEAEQKEVTEESYEEVEIKKERTETTTTYQLENGEKRTECYSEPVRFKDEETGELKDYDMSLKKMTDKEGYMYENRRGDKKNYFPKTISEDTPIYTESEDYQMSLYSKEIEEEKGTVKKEEVTDIYGETEEKKVSVTYKGIEENTEYNYESRKDGLKESIIINEKPETARYISYIELTNCYPGVAGKTKKSNAPKNVQAVTGQAVTIYDSEDNHIVGEIPAAYLVDAKGEHYSMECSYALQRVEKEGEKVVYQLILTVDENYFENEELTYPVTLDPSLKWTGSTYIEDTYVRNDYLADYNFSGIDLMLAGKNSSDCIMRTYVKFPEVENIIKGKYISFARLCLYEDVNSQEGAQIQVARAKEAWDSQRITYNNQPELEIIKATTSRVKGVQYHKQTVTMKDYILGLAKGQYENHGVAIMTPYEADAGYEKSARFYTSEYKNATYHPTLEIHYYDVPTAPESLELSQTYAKAQTSTTLTWSGVESEFLDYVHTRVMKLDDETGEEKGVYYNYNPYNRLGETSSGTAEISSIGWPEGCYRIYVRGVDDQGNEGEEGSIELHIDSTAPTLSNIVVQQINPPFNYQIILSPKDVTPLS